MAEGSPLLSPKGSSRSQRQTLLGLAAFAAASFACVALLSPATSRTVLSGDGVVPVSQLSFTKAEEAHFKGVKKLGDVGSRSAMNSYFDHLGEEQQAEHKAALKHVFSSQSLNQWFNSMGEKYFKANQVEKAERKARHPGQLFVHRTIAKQVEERSAEEPDDVPMEKKESVEDKMIQTVADYQRKQQESQAAKESMEESHEILERAAVKKVVEKENHFKEMREQSEEEAAKEQKKAVAQYKAALIAKTEAAKKPVEEREKKVRQSVKDVEADEDKTVEQRRNRQIKHEEQANEARVDDKKEAAEKKDILVARHASYEQRQKDVRDEVKEKADERAQNRKERKTHRQHLLDADRDKFKVELAKKAEERQALITRNLERRSARKAAEKAKLQGKSVDKVPLQTQIEAAEKIQDSTKGVPLQIKKSAAGNKVKIGFYMESMCPGCKYYTKTVLGALMEKPDFVSMVDFTLYPYGNGKLTGDSIQCQHGEKECEGNTILACMQEEYPITSDSTGFVPAFVCMEEENGVPKDDFKKCAFTHNLDFDTVMTCANGPKGKALALAAARNTEALNPPHEYAPWLTLNGAPMRDDAYDLQKNVCAAYDSGDQAVSGLCSVASLKAIGKKDRAMLHDGGGRGFSVCHKDAWAR